MSEDVVRLVLDGKLQRKTKLAGEHGYMSLLLDLEEVRGPWARSWRAHRAPDQGQAVHHGQGRGRPHQARPPEDVTVINPINRCPTVVVPAQEVERFDREYVSLFAIARQRRQHFLLVSPCFSGRRNGALASGESDGPPQRAGRLKKEWPRS
jgi:hypothetical protein